MDPFVGEIRLMPYGGSFITRGWAPCDGTLLPIRQYTALFALLGTQYGGDGINTFGLPDLRGRAVVGQGQGPGLSSYPQGMMTGVESVTLTTAQMPTHTHSLGTPSVPVNAGPATTGAPAGAVFAKTSPEAFGPGTANGPMAAGMLSGNTVAAGSNQAHENRMPFLTLGYFIATQGVFPARQ